MAPFTPCTAHQARIGGVDDAIHRESVMSPTTTSIIVRLQFADGWFSVTPTRLSRPAT